MILGIDEAGRGPWAGPLVVGVVVLGGAEIDGLTDSKKLTKKKRELLEPLIYDMALGVGLGWVSAAELDEIGMSAALRLATIRAVQEVTCTYDEIIIDGTVNFLKETGKGKYVKTMPKADLLIPSVSAASIVAKVARDRYMTEYGEKFPDYGFASHAGYGTAKHRAAIEAHGVTPEHRLSFAPLQKYVSAASSPVSSAKYPTTASRRASLAYAAGEARAADVAVDLPTNGSAIKTTKSLGDAAESKVAAQLESDGHVVFARNWRTKFCEIDIVSIKDDTVYFTEVKYRKEANWGDGLAAITNKKQQQMRFAAELFAVKHPQFARYDQVLMAASVSGEEFTIDNLFELS